jgi:magnesium and cobalt exporter, CNNM family
MTFDHSLEIAAIAALLLFAGFLVTAGTAIGASSRSRMTELERRGIAQATAVRQLIASPERVTSAIVVGATAALVLATAIATRLALDWYGLAGPAYAAALIAILALLFVQALPKAIAAIAPDRIALVTAAPFTLVTRLLAPLAVAIDTGITRLLKLVGINPTTASSRSVDDELRGTIDLHQRTGTAGKIDLDMLGGVLDLKELELFDVMVHRTKMRSLDAASPPAQILEEVLKSGHSRFPVWRERPDNIVGVLHAKDLFAALQAAHGDVTRIDIEEILTPPWFVPDTTSVADQLAAFLRRKVHFALVVDEYGEVMGLVTLEDILEEIVGEIRDEHDVGAVGVRRESSGSYVVDGAVPIRDLNRMHGWHLPDDEATTIAGLVIHEAQMIPEAGQAFTFHGFRFEVVRKRRNQLVSIRVTPLGERQV